MGRSPLGAGFQSVLDEDDFFISSKLSWLDTESLVDKNIGVENAFFAFGSWGFVQILIHIDNETWFQNLDSLSLIVTKMILEN